MPDISVIIPAYNRAGLIGETLWSLLNQTVPAKEIIVVDDGSQDGTAETVLEMLKLGEAEKLKISEGRPWPEFKVFRQENAGPGAARNRGLAEATGEFIHFFDSDDIAAPNKQEVQLQALLETGADIAYGPWCKGRFLPLEKLKHGKADRLKEDLTTKIHENTRKGEKQGGTQGTCAGAAFSNPSTSELARDIQNTSLIRSADGPSEALEARRLTLDSGPWNFVPEGPVLQARGLPKGDLVQALLTNWSIVPHACLFRRSILEKAGGFPEDIWVGEDQLLFLRCLLAGARVVHTPGTMVFYRVGNDLGKLTATGAAQKRHARDWGRFLLKANEEVSSAEWRLVGKRTSSTTEDTTEHLDRGEEEQTKFGPKGERVGTTESKSTEGGQGDAQGTRAGAAFSNPSASELARDSENTSPSRCASGPSSYLPATSCSLPVTRRPSAWFGFLLRAYEAWRDLGNFFPGGENKLKNELQAIWKRNWFSGLRFQVSGFVLRKWGGLMNQIFGHRVKGCFRPGKFTSREATLFDNR